MAPLPDKETRCHHTAFEKRCFDMVVEHRCRKWCHFLGKDPQTGADIDVWDCRDHLEHLFWIEAARQQRGTTASVDKLANEVAKANDSGMASALMGLNGHLTALGGAASVTSVEVDPAPKLIQAGE